MLAIRLQRIGKKGQPSYRLVVAERRSKLGAPPTEDLGSYDPRTKAANFKAERVNHWLSVGASATTTVHNLLVKAGVINAPKRPVRIPFVAPKAEEPKASSQGGSADGGEAAAPVAEPAAEEAPASAAVAGAEEASVEEKPAE